MCYAGPLAAAAVTTAIWAKTKSEKIWWLNLMFWGGALFGVIDHWWNGELFLISEHIVKDLLLGVVIVAGILISWGILVARRKIKATA